MTWGAWWTRGHDCPSHRTKGHQGLNWGSLNMICVCIMRNWQAVRKRREKIFYKNSLEFWPFYPPRSNPDPMANSHLSSMVNKLTFRIHTPFSQTNKAFLYVWITQECTHLPVNTAISGFADGTEPALSLVFRFYALIACWECECHKIGGHPILTRKIDQVHSLHPNNSTSMSSLQASTAPACRWVIWGSDENMGLEWHLRFCISK